MPFGKHKGEDVADLPEDYLHWLIENVDLWEPLRSAVYRSLGKEDPERQLLDLYGIYRKLAQKWHPDHGGNTQAMQAINEFYERAQKEIQLLPK